MLAKRPIDRRRLWTVAVFVTAAVLTWLLWPAPKGVPLPPLPSPNGYDDFIKAAQPMASAFSDYSKMSREELRSCIETHQEPLRLVRLGLGRECLVPTEDSMAYINRHLPELSSIKGLAQLLSAEARLAEAEGRYDEAAGIHLEVVRYGQASSHGGLMIDKLVGMAIESIGMNGLDRMGNQLSAPSCRATVSALEEIDARSDSAAVYLNRDRQWARKVSGLKEWIQSAWLNKSLFPHRQTDQKFIIRLLATDRRRRQLLLGLAARAYELEKGQRPRRVEELVPSVLRAIPKDPETGTNLELRLPP